MKCNHCQKEIEDSAKICPYCHTPVIRIKPKKICGYCYTELKKGDKTCKGCGRKDTGRTSEAMGGRGIGG